MRTVAVLIYDAVNPFELGVATEVFGFERPELGVPWYRFFLCADEKRPIRSSAGFLLTTPYSLEHVEEADTIIVPGPRPGIVPVSEALLEALRRSHQRGARIITLCTGTFLLAATGLLDGRCVTTHWASGQQNWLRAIPGCKSIHTDCISMMARSSPRLARPQRLISHSTWYARIMELRSRRP